MMYHITRLEPLLKGVCFDIAAGKDLRLAQFTTTALKMAQAWVQTFESVVNGSVEINELTEFLK